MRYKIFILLLLPLSVFAQRRTGVNSLLTKADATVIVDAATAAANAAYEPKVTAGTSSQYYKGDKTWGTFPTTTAAFTSSTDKNFVTDAQAVIIGNTSGTNSGDNAANSLYANDYRAANFVAGTNYLAPNGNGGSLTGLTATQVGLANVNNTSDAAKPVSTATQTALDLKANLISPSFTTPALGTPASGNLANCTFPTLINNGGWTELHVTGSNATTTGQSLVDITGLTSGTLAASTKYEFIVILDVTTSAVTTGIQFGVFCGGSGNAGVISAILEGTTTGTTGSVEVLNTTPATASTARLLTSGQSGTIIIRGFVTTRSTGTPTISIQMLKVTSGTATVKIGSVFRYRLAQ
jgi:hypothetical protein